MKDNDFDSPVSVGPIFRGLTALAFLLIAAFCGYMAIVSLLAKLEGSAKSYADLSFVSITAVFAISLGYVGFRLIVVSDKERLLSRVASFIGAFLFMGGAVAILLTSGDMTSGDMKAFAGAVAIGGWLFYYAKHSP